MEGRYFYVAYDHAGNPKGRQTEGLSKIDLLPPREICTETYLVIGAYDFPKSKRKNLTFYMRTKFFPSLSRSCILTILRDQHMTSFPSST